MAIKTWYLNQISGDLFYDDDAGAVSETLSNSGWVVAKLAPTRYAILNNGTEANSNTFTTTDILTSNPPVVNVTFNNATPYTPPSLIVSSDSITTLFLYNAVFPAGTWTFDFPLRAQSNGGTQDGRVRLRVFKAQRSGDTFSNTTELTTVALNGTTVTNLTTTTTQTSTVTWSAPAFSLENEYLIIKIAWEITGASNNNNSDIRFMYGNTATMTTPEFRKKRYNVI